MALARLSNLQQLRLGGMQNASLGAALTTLVQLPQLTLLECFFSWPSDLQVESQSPSRALASPLSEALQQLLMQPLPLKILQLPGGDLSQQSPVFNMGRLTKLTELRAGGCLLAEDTVLPTQLQRLWFPSWAGADSMAPLMRLELKQLQHLSLCVDFEQPQLLLQLAQLPALTHLALHYDSRCEGEPAAATASAWPMLPQLRELVIEHSKDALPNQPQWEAILAGAAAAVGLTKLTLDARMISDELQEELSLAGDEYFDERWASEVAACASLAKLTCLQDLTIDGSDTYFKFNLVRGDALALTALTRLTHLRLFGAEHGVGTAVATALARSLQQLQSLDLYCCSLQLGSAEGLACLEAIGRLTQLTELRLSCNEGLTQQGLMLLTGLSRLEQLGYHDLCNHVSNSAAQVTDEEMAAFWAAVHAQRL
jgi:hypothetical protein